MIAVYIIPVLFAVHSSGFDGNEEFLIEHFLGRFQAQLALAGKTLSVKNT